MHYSEEVRDRERLFEEAGACPRCGSPLLRLSDAWACTSCGERSRRGTSAFFVHSAIDGGRVVRAKTIRRQAWKRMLRSPHLSHNNQSTHLRALVAESDGTVVDLGSGERRLGPRVLNLDVAEYLGVDLVCTSPRLPFKSGSIDLVICQAVLEHVQSPHELVREVLRVLRRSGRCYAEIPFMQPFHADPDDYTRFTHHGLRELFRDFEVIGEGVCVGPASAVASLVRELLLSAVVPGTTRTVFHHALGWLLCPLPQFDRILSSLPEARRCASGLYVLVARP